MNQINHLDKAVILGLACTLLQKTYEQARAPFYVKHKLKKTVKLIKKNPGAIQTKEELTQVLAFSMTAAMGAAVNIDSIEELVDKMCRGDAKEIYKAAKKQAYEEYAKADKEAVEELAKNK